MIEFNYLNEFKKKKKSVGIGFLANLGWEGNPFVYFWKNVKQFSLLIK